MDSVIRLLAQMELSLIMDFAEGFPSISVEESRCITDDVINLEIETKSDFK